MLYKIHLLTSSLLYAVSWILQIVACELWFRIYDSSRIISFLLNQNKFHSYKVVQYQSYKETALCSVHLIVLLLICWDTRKSQKHQKVLLLVFGHVVRRSPLKVSGIPSKQKQTKAADTRSIEMDLGREGRKGTPRPVSEQSCA